MNTVKGFLLHQILPDERLSIGSFCVHSNDGYCLIKDQKHLEFAEEFEYEVTKPIVVSKQLPIRHNDYAYGGLGDLFKISRIVMPEDEKDKTYNPGEFGYYRILVMPEMFSEQTLNDLAEGRLVFYEEVLVKYDEGGFHSAGHIDSGDQPDPPKVVLDDNGHATIMPITKEPAERYEKLIKSLKKWNIEGSEIFLDDINNRKIIIS